MIPDQWCRGIRAAVFAAACVLLTATGHVLMSDTSVPWWALAAAFAVTGGAAWWLADRERGPVGVTAATVAAQAALHTCFSLAQGATWAPGSWLSYLTGGASGPATATTASTHTAHTSHTVLGHDHMAHATMGHTTMGRDPMGYASTGQSAMGGGPMDLSTMDLTPMSGHDMADMSASGMLAAHLFAALLCGLWLAHGERAAFRVLRALAALVLAPLRLVLHLPAPPHRPRIRARRHERARRLRQLLLAHVLTSRGPPPVAAAL
ncbi:hypothetical protein [Streptomyces sp. NPDC026092]|uniref:hypothetical protein n=1 Tax=Streptomyces sp. NPDC026092 TaxID=3154797 RepID=UPI0033D83800